MKKKVLFIIESLGCGGAEKSLVSLLPLLDIEKYELFLWEVTPGGVFSSLVPSYVKKVEQPLYSPWGNFCKRMAFLSYSVAIRFYKLIRKKEYWGETYYKYIGWAMKIPDGEWDAVVAYHQGLMTYLVADKFKAKKKLGWVNADIFKTGYNVKFNSPFYRKIDYICPVSDVLCELMKKNMPEFSDKYNTVWDIINPNITRDLSHEEVQNLRTSRNESILVTTGRLHELKGYDMAVAAADILKTNGLDFKWYFIGEGGERPKIEGLIQEKGLQDNVILLGLKTNPYAYMRQADVYVQPSRHEGFGMTIAEAKILGLPVVSTNFEVVHNQIKHEYNGLISEMNPACIASNIQRILTDCQLRDRIINNLKKEENNTCHTEVQKVEKLLDS